MKTEEANEREQEAIGQAVSLVIGIGLLWWTGLGERLWEILIG